MNNWTFFADLYAQIAMPAQAMVNQILAALITWVVPVFRAGIALYLILTFGTIALGGNTGEPVSDVIRRMMKLAIVLFVISSAGTFNQYAGDLFLNTIPTEITAAVSGATGVNGGPNAMSGAIFDQSWNKGFTGGLVVFKALPWSAKGVALCLVVVLFWILALLAVGVAFLIYLVAHIFLCLVVAIGPICVALYPFQATRRFFEGWVSACISLVMTKVIAVVLITMLLGSQNLTLSRLAQNGGEGNEIGQLMMLMGIGLLFFICAYIAKQIPSVSIGIFGGIYTNVSHYSSMMYSSVGSPLRHGSRLASAGVRAAAPRVAAAAQSMRASITPPGRSIS